MLNSCIFTYTGRVGAAASAKPEVATAGPQLSRPMGRSLMARLQTTGSIVVSRLPAFVRVRRALGLKHTRDEAFREDFTEDFKEDFWEDFFLQSVDS
jgi:hypothetical protein